MGRKRSPSDGRNASPSAPATDVFYLRTGRRRLTRSHFLLGRSLQADAFVLFSHSSRALPGLSRTADGWSGMAKFEVEGLFHKRGSPWFSCLPQISSREAGNKVKKKKMLQGLCWEMNCLNRWWWGLRVRSNKSYWSCTARRAAWEGWGRS